MPEPEKRDPLDRLSDAVAAYLEGETQQLGREELLAKHEEIRDLLEPMLDQGGADKAAVDQYAMDQAAVDPGAVDETATDGAPAGGGTTEAVYLGEYRIVREIGRGGMGVVYEAEDVSLGRRVALKVLPPHLTQGPRQIERFRREAAAAARLDHPGIVPIYRVGEDRGSHYFAMELVKGRSLHTVLTGIRDSAADFESGFSAVDLGAGIDGGYVAQAVEVVAQVAEALAAAHAGGVIHRDIKPHNILLSESGVVRVVDFGLAKDLGRATISQSHEIAGTPHYMSPEQISSLRDVDHRTDVYSLGVVLYELLTLRCPFDSESTQGLMLSITLQEPEALRNHSPRVPRDLELVCHKAIEKAPAHRYATAAEFAADLRRFLNHEPVVAEPPSTFTRVAKFIRRRRAATATIAVGASIAVAGAVFYFGYYRPTSDALAAERDESKKVRQQGDETFIEAKRVLEQHLDRAVDLARQPGMLETSRAMMKEAVVALERLKEHRARFPSHADILGQAYMQMGSAQFRTGENDLALMNFERSYEVLDELYREHPDSGRFAFLRAKALSYRGVCRCQFGHSAEAERDQREAIAILERQQADATGVATADSIKSLLVQCYQGLGTAMYADSRRAMDTLAAFDRAIEIFDTLPPAIRDEPEIIARRIEAQRSRGRLFSVRGAWKSADAAFRGALQACESAVAKHGASLAFRRKLGGIHFGLGQVYQNTDRDADAASEFEHAIGVFRSLHTDFPRLAPSMNNLARCLRDLGLLHGKHGRKDEADKALREAVVIAERLPATDVVFYRSVLASAYAALARLRSDRMKRGDFPAVDALFEKAIAIQAELVAKNPRTAGYHHQLALTLQNHGSLLLAMRDAGRAAATIERAIRHQSAAIAAEPHNARYTRFLALHYWAMAETELQRKDHTAAAAATRKAIGGSRQSARFVYTAANNLARCAALAAKDGGLIPLERDELVAGLCADSIAFLQKAVAAGVPTKVIRRNPAFRILHGRDGWQGLVGNNR